MKGKNQKEKKIKKVEKEGWEGKDAHGSGEGSGTQADFHPNQ